MARALTVVTILCLGFFLYLRFQMALTQHFDVDEYTYLHLAAAVSRGEAPFRDFYFVLPPGFLWFLVPVFWIFPTGLTPFIAARILQFGSFVLLAASLFWLFWEVKKTWLALLAPILLFFLPLPLIKFTELRPDTLGMAFVVLAMVFATRYLQRRKYSDGITSGIFYGLSLFVIPKMAPAVIVGLLFMFRRIRWPVIGLGAVVLAGLAWLFVIGGVQAIDTAFYSLVLVPLEVQTKLGELFPIPLNFFFLPNAFFYGDGSDTPRLINHGVWGFAAVIAFWRILTKKESFITVTAVAQTLVFLVVSTHHAQYLIPIAVWVAWYVADGINEIRKVILPVFFAIFYIAAVAVLVSTALFVQRTRWVLPMQDTFTLLERIWSIVPSSEYIFDLEGATLYYKDPYYACCMPFGQTQQHLTRPLPDLVDALERTQTKYIYQGASGRVITLPPRAYYYIQANYVPWEGHKEFLVRTF